MKAILKVLIVWITLLAVPLHGFASSTMSACAPLPAAALHDHDHDGMTDNGGSANVDAHNGHAAPDAHSDHARSAHHHAGKCAACATCGSCVAMAPSFIAVLPVSAAPLITVPFNQHLLQSVDLALPERPPRA
ncbi:MULTISPECIES: DUF2946 family protein [Massilia]|uniref:DUF2946 family protein n=1 Tax=Massilia TaxID=149698 RepID=UPI000D68690A|nr:MULTISPECIES: DUF2946 family protein [Massilia]